LRFLDCTANFVVQLLAVMPREKSTHHSSPKKSRLSAPVSSPGRLPIDSPRCLSCGQKFRQRTNVIRHLAVKHGLDLKGNKLTQEQIDHQKRRYEKRTTMHHRRRSSDAPAAAGAPPAEVVDVQDSGSDLAVAAATHSPAAASSDLAVSTATVAVSQSDTAAVIDEPGKSIPDIATIIHPFVPLQAALDLYENISSSSPCSSTQSRRDDRFGLFGLDSQLIEMQSIPSLNSSPDRRLGHMLSGTRCSTPTMDELNTPTLIPSSPNETTTARPPPRPLTPHVVIRPMPMPVSSTVIIGTITTAPAFAVAAATTQPPVAVVAASDVAVAAQQSCRLITQPTATVAAGSRKRKLPTKKSQNGSGSSKSSSSASVADQPPALVPASAAPVTTVNRATSPTLPPEPQPMRLTFSGLCQELNLHPDEPVATIANRLAVRFSWTPAERRAHEDRLFDIRGGMAVAMVREHGHIPVDRTLAAAEQYFRELHGRSVRAFQFRDTMEER